MSHMDDLALPQQQRREETVGRLMQACIDRVNDVLREQIIGMRVVRAFVREPVEMARFDDANVTVTETA